MGLPGVTAARPGLLHMSLVRMLGKTARRPVAMKLWTCRVKWLRGLVGYTWVEGMLQKAARRPEAMKMWDGLA